MRSPSPPGETREDETRGWIVLHSVVGEGEPRGAEDAEPEASKETYPPASVETDATDSND